MSFVPQDVGPRGYSRGWYVLYDLFVPQPKTCLHTIYNLPHDQSPILSRSSTPFTGSENIVEGDMRSSTKKAREVASQACIPAGAVRAAAYPFPQVALPHTFSWPERALRLHTVCYTEVDHQVPGCGEHCAICEAPSGCLALFSFAQRAVLSYSFGIVTAIHHLSPSQPLD